MKVGYKNTEIGLIPEDWEVVSFNQLSNPNDKHSITGGPFGSNLQSKDYTLRGIRIIQLQNIGNGKFHDDYAIFTSSKKADELKSCNIYPGEIILSKMGDPVARAAILPNIDKRYLMCSDGIRLNVDENYYDKKFVFYYINFEKFRKIAESFSTGSTRKRIGLSHLKQIPFLKPSPKEQQAIASALSDIDELIANLEKLVQKKIDIKTATMQQLLTGKKRLSGFNQKWSERYMTQDSYLKARIGWQGLTTAEYKETGKYILITGTDFKNGRIDWDSCCYVEQERYEQDKNIQIQEGDILLTKDGTIGKVAYVDKLPELATLNSGVFVIRPLNNSYYPLYFYYVLRSKIFGDFLNKLQAGSTINHLYQKDFIHFSFVAPQIEEQKAIAKILFDMDREIESLEKQLEKAKLVKIGMMQELLTGKTRLINKE